MPRSRIAYLPEFRQKMVELVASGRGPEEFAKEFEPSAQTCNWVKRAQADGGKRHDVLTSAEREELTKLRRELKPVNLKREADQCIGLRSGGYAGMDVYRRKKERAPLAQFAFRQCSNVDNSGYRSGKRNGHGRFDIVLYCR